MVEILGALGQLLSQECQVGTPLVGSQLER
jgi:hypothetical protein